MATVLPLPRTDVRAHPGPDVYVRLADYTQLAAPFFVYPLPVIAGLSPASGPVAGDTTVDVTGSGLAGGSWRQCAFNLTLVNASRVGDEKLRCLVPPSLLGVGPLSVSLSLNGQQFSRLAMRFEQYLEPVVLSLSPVIGPTLGGTTVLLHGDHLHGGSDRLCHFGALAPVTAVPVLDSSNATCLMPPSAVVGDAPLRLSLNGQQYTAARPTARFKFLSPILELVVSPASGPIDGNTMLRIAGCKDFTAGVHLLCRFGQPFANSVFSTTIAIVDAAVSASNASELECTPPTLPAGTAIIEVDAKRTQCMSQALI